MFDKNIFGEKIYKLRKSKNLSRQKLADIAGISQDAIAKIENKQRAASIEVIYAIAEYFNISIDWLVGLSDIKERNMRE